MIPLSLGCSVMSDFSILEDQLGLYKKQCEELESWQADHLEAMRCQSLEDAISFGLSLLKNIQRHNTAWAADIESGLTEFSWEDAKQFAAWYGWWLDRSKLLLTAVTDYEKRGYNVEGANLFREQFTDISLLPLDIENTKKSIESLAAGRGIPLKQAVDELPCGKG